MYTEQIVNRQVVNRQEEQLILVNKDNRAIGTAAKLRVHREGLLHRAFSVLLFNDKGETLLQRRASCKYHAPNLWANACCSHPRLSETPLAAAQRRLSEELGISCPLKEVTQLSYKAYIDNGLTENEYVHVLQGTFTGACNLNPEEVAAIRWIRPETLCQEVEENAAAYAPWLRIYVREYFSVLFTQHT